MQKGRRKGRVGEGREAEWLCRGKEPREGRAGVSGVGRDTHRDCSYSLIFAFTRDTMELNVRFPLSAICPIVRWKSWN